MAYRDRGGIGPGFDPVAGSVVSGSDNVQNARIDLIGLERARENKNPLFPHQSHTHPLAVPAFQGEFAFIYKPSDSFTSVDTNYRTMRNRDSLDSGGWTETGDTVYYNTILNGQGDASIVSSFDSQTEAQRSYRSKIRVVGIVRDTVTNMDNTKTLGNTIVTSKGKITTFNSGFDSIYAGSQVSWDILPSDKADSSGWAKCKLVEPGRLPLICTPTKTLTGSVEELVNEYEDQLRNKNMSSSLKRIIRGALKLSVCFDAQLTNIKIGNVFARTNPGVKPDPFAGAGLKYFASKRSDSALNSLMRTKALLSLDEEEFTNEDLSMLGFSDSTVSDLHLDVTSLDTFKDAFEVVADGLSKNNAHVEHLNAPGGHKRLFSSLAEFGVVDIITGIMTSVSSSQQRFVGVAASDSIPGNKFDLVL